jgi:hypothetical protein
MPPPSINTPRGYVFVTATGKAELKWNTDAFTGSGIGSGGSWQDRFTNAQQFVDSEILRLCEPYIPLRTGMLVMSGILGTFVGSGEVSWIAPYARRQYYSPRKPGSETGLLRGPYWFERGKAIWGSQVIAGARRIAGGKK